RFIRGEEVSANPDNVFAKLARWGYRHRRLVLSLVLFAITLGAVGVAFSLYDRIKAGRIEAARTEFRHRRTQELSRLLGLALGASRSLDRQISKMEHSLHSTTTEALLLLNAKLTVDDAPATYSLLDLHDPEKRPATLVDSPGFGFTVDLGNIAYHVSRGSHPEKYLDRVRRLTLLQPMLMRAVVESGSGAVLSEENMTKLRERALQKGVPLVSIYFGFHDGLFVTYPGELGIDGGGVYDHRRRPWYLDRVLNRRSEAIVWGSPYLSVNNKLVLTCTLPMIDTRGKNHGIAAIDVSLTEMVNELRGEGNQGAALLAKSIVDADGNIVLDLDERFLRDTRSNYQVVDGKLKFLRYPDQELLRQIRQRRAGYILRRENGRDVAYVFAGMFSVPWCYIEKLDLDRALAERGVAQPPEL
ncbi:MAG: cache domain-containing protein, partial [Lentisphaeria bacterium]|nr:cache domain-containing protein [Lentisphaeria bacterium]